MTFLLWTVLILFTLLLLVIAFFGVQYRAHRQQTPQPVYKQAAQKPTHDKWSDDEVTVAWVGHSTLYINLFGVKILTDPVFSEKVGIGLGNMRVGVKRHTAPAMTLQEVGPVDLILLSHAHLDHFDLPSLRRLTNPKTQVVTAKNISHLLGRIRFGNVYEVGGKDSVTLDNGVKITAVPVRHWGRRFPWNKDYGWTGYLIEHKGVRLFFAGDTAYTATFRELQQIGKIDIAFMPIGAYDPYLAAHCSPEQAWHMFIDADAKWLVPIHWDTFVLSREPVTEPLERLLAAAGVQHDRVVIREHGETFVLPLVLEDDDRAKVPEASQVIQSS